MLKLSSSTSNEAFFQKGIRDVGVVQLFLEYAVANTRQLLFSLTLHYAFRCVDLSLSLAHVYMIVWYITMGFTRIFKRVVTTQLHYRSTSIYSIEECLIKHIHIRIHISYTVIYIYYICIRIHTYIYLCLYVCVCVYIYICISFISFVFWSNDEAYGLHSSS